MDMTRNITHLAYNNLVLLIRFLALFTFFAVRALPLSLRLPIGFLNQTRNQWRVMALIMVPTLTAIAL